MIKRIDSANYELISDLVERYRCARNKAVDVFLEPEWVDLILEGFRSRRFYGLCYADGDACRGFLEYKLGRKSGFCSMIYAINSKDRGQVLRELVGGLRNACPRRNILVSETAPGISTDFQKAIFEGQGFGQVIRWNMERGSYGAVPEIERPGDIVFRKYHRNMDRLVVKLDERAYKNHPDEVILKILTDIDNIPPSLRIVHSNWTIFESKLSYFAFRDEELAGAIYCTRIGHELGIANIAIDPQYQGQGLGMAMISKVLRGMKAHGYRKCSLMVSKDNLPAINLYKKFNFKLKRICPIFVYRSGQGV